MMHARRSQLSASPTSTSPRAASPRKRSKLGLLLLLLVVLGALALWLNRDTLRRRQLARASTSELVAQARANPSDGVVVKLAGQRCLDEDRSGDARDFLLRAVQANPSDPQLNLLAGRAMWDSGDPERAGAFLNTALQAAPQDPDVLFWTGELLLSRGRVKDALALLLDATRLDPNRGAIWKRLGEIELNDQHYPEALKYLNQAEAHEPSGATSRLRAVSLQMLSRLPEAEQAARLAVEREKSPINFRVLGDIVQQSQDDERAREAQKYFREALRLDPRDALAMKLLAINQRGLGEHAQAVKVLRRLLRVMPSLTEAYLMLSQSYQALGKPALAAGTLRIFRQLQPLQEKADRAGQRVVVERGAQAAQLAQAQALLDLGRNDDARQVLERAWSKAPHTPAIEAMLRRCDQPPTLRIEPLPPDAEGDKP